MNYIIILPSLKVSGGVLEAYRLAKKISDNGCNCKILCLWKTKTPIDANGIQVLYLSNWETNIKYAIFQLPFIFLNFIKFSKKIQNTKYIFTHYSTIPLINSPFIKNKIIFIQGIEWEFIKIPLINSIYKKILISTYKKNNILSANEYIKIRLEKENVASNAMPLWADSFFLSNEINLHKKTDILIMIRKGFIKRPDLYFELLLKFKTKENINIKVITPEPEIHDRVQNLGYKCVLNPHKNEIKSLYNESKIFIFLSENEGFGLPPAEAMGSGCVPFCRDSGGPSSYMIGPLKEFLFPLNYSIDLIIEKSINTINNEHHIKDLQTYCIKIFKENDCIRNKFNITNILQ